MTQAEWRLIFSKKVTSKMIQLGMTQRELSQLTRVPENTLSRYINGERIPRVDVVINIAKALGCSVTELTQFGDIITK